MIAGAAVGAALQVLVGLAVAFGVLPYVLLRRDPALSPFVRFWRALVLGSGAWLAGGFLLAAAASIELATVGLLVAFAIGLAAYLRSRQGSLAKQKAARDEQAAKMLDAMDPESQHSLASLALDAARQILPWLRHALTKLAKAENLLAFLVLALIALRQFPPLLAQSAPGTPEGYVQLLAAKTLALNMGLYSQGVFPVGVPLIAALMSTSFFLDPLNILRFLGPAVAVLLPLAAGLLALEVADSPWAVFTAAALTGLTVLPALGIGTVTVWHPLALHLGTLYLLVELAFCLRALQRSSPSAVPIAAVAGFAAVMSQPYLWPFAAGLPILLGLPWLRSRQIAARAMLAAFAGSTVALLPVAIGLLGHHPPAAILMAAPALPGAPPPEWLSGPGGVALLLAVGLVLSAVSLWRWRTLRDDAPLYLGIGLVLLAFGGACLLPLPGTLGSVLSLGDLPGLVALPLLSGIALSLVANRSQYPAAAQGLALLLAAGGIVAGFAPAQPLTRYEVPGSEAVLQKISGFLEAYQWTVISPTEQYSELLGKGWHVELVDFLAKVPLAVARKASLRPAAWPGLPILTSDTFLYVPLVTSDGIRPTTADRAAPLPTSLSAAENLGPAGAVLDAHAYAWAMAYHKAHPSSSSFYYRSPGLLVLWIRQ